MYVKVLTCTGHLISIEVSYIKSTGTEVQLQYLCIDLGNR